MDGITIAIVNWSERRAEITSVRRAVFVEEQNVPESLELDGKDPDCRHVLACDKLGAPVGTARLDAAGRIGRMAVLREHRRSGIGREILRVIMDYGRANGITNFRVSSQVSAIGFYEKMGFVSFGEEFEEAGIMHIGMRLPHFS